MTADRSSDISNIGMVVVSLREVILSGVPIEYAAAVASARKQADALCRFLMPRRGLKPDRAALNFVSHICLFLISHTFASDGTIVAGDETPEFYRAPLRDMSFVLRELAGIDGIAALPGSKKRPTCSIRCSRRPRRLPRRCWIRSTQSATAPAARGTTARSRRRPVSKKPTSSSRKPAGSVCRSRPSTAAKGCRRCCSGRARDVERGQRRLRQRTAAQSGRDRSASNSSAPRSRSSAYIPRPRLRQVDRHDVPHRAASRLGSRRGAHAGRARRRPLPDQRDRRSSSRSASTT